MALKTYMGITYEVAKQNLDEAIAKYQKACEVQSYTVGTRGVTRASPDSLLRAVRFWSDIVAKCEAGTAGVKIQRAIPQDF